MLIAVASKSGVDVDQHFGHAERFLIYDFVQGRPKRVDEVRVEKYCSFDPDNPMRHRQFDGIVAALKGCRVVVTAMIGEYPKQELLKAGVETVSTEGPVEDALRLAHDTLCGCSRRKCE